MSHPFEVGDVVMLKSGGPAMTVTLVDTPSHETTLHVWVAWFDGPTAKHGSFPVDAVVLAKVP